MSPRAASSPPDIPGYRYLDLLGMGGFADVFLYEQRSMGGRKVAVKVLLEGLRSDLQQAFEDEARAMARLSSHPSIVSVIDAGQTPDGRAYLVMEHCPGAHLGSQVKNRPLNLAKALEVAIQVAGAVETAHAAGIIHRDIKPANILFTEYNRPALTDFGISTSTTSTKGKAVGVSVPWAPPEQLAAGAETDATGDVYSLAATLYTALTGHPPFWRAEGPNDNPAMGGRISNDPVPPLGRDDVPASLQRVLDVAMSKNTQQRYPTALEFARALQQVQLELHLPVTAADVRVELVQAENQDDSEFGGTIAAAYLTIEATPAGPTTEMRERSGPGFTGSTAQLVQTEGEAAGGVPRAIGHDQGPAEAVRPIELTGPGSPVLDDGHTELRTQLSPDVVTPDKEDHRTRRHVALWAVVAVVVLVIVAGGVVFLNRGTSTAATQPTSSQGNGPSTNAPSTPAAATKGGTLNILMSTKMMHLDPQRVDSSVNNEATNRLFIRTLVSWAPTTSDLEVADIVPDLATDTGKVSADGKTWSFTLKDGIKWEDGQEITADDVKYGISRRFAVDVITGAPNYAIAVLDIPTVAGSSAYKGPYAKIGQDLFDKAVTVSGKTITFKLNRSLMDFNNMVTMTAFAPFRRDKDLGDKSNYAVFSSGPYKLDGVWTSGKGGTFVRNDSWDPATDTIRKAYPDKIVWDESLTPETLYARLIADQGDDKFAITYDPAPWALANAVNAAGRKSIVASQDTRFLLPNFKSMVVSNNNARLAFALATDRSAYITAAGGSQAAVATNSLINPNLLAFPNTPLPAGETGNSAKAKQLLQSSGLTLPVTISVAYAKSDTSDRAFAGMKASWDAAGFNTQLVAIPADTYYDTVQAPDSASKYDVFSVRWDADYPSASTVIPRLFDSRINISASGPGVDLGYFSDGNFNAKIDATNKITDMAAREKAWGDLDKQLTSSFFACIPLINDRFVFVHGSNVKGLFVNGSYYDPATVSLKD